MLKRLQIVPFEACIAGLLILSGIAGIFHFGVTDPVSALLPVWEAVALNVLALLSGIWTMAGIASGVGKIEQAGLWILNGVIASRFILYGYYLGYGQNFFLTGIFDLTVLVASFARMSSIRGRHVLVRLREYDKE